MKKDRESHKIMRKLFIGTVKLPNGEMLGLNSIWLFVMPKDKACHKIMDRPFFGIVRRPNKEMLGLSTI